MHHKAITYTELSQFDWRIDELNWLMIELMWIDVEFYMPMVYNQ